MDPILRSMSIHSVHEAWALYPHPLFSWRLLCITWSGETSNQRKEMLKQAATLNIAILIKEVSNRFSVSRSFWQEKDVYLASKWCKWWSRNASTLCIFLRSPSQTYRTRPATERSPGGVICTWARLCASFWCCGAKTFLLEGRRRTFWVKHSCGLRMREWI